MKIKNIYLILLLIFLLLLNYNIGNTEGFYVGGDKGDDELANKIAINKYNELLEKEKALVKCEKKLKKLEKK